MDFSDIRSASKDEMIRAWAVEETSRVLPIGVDGATLVNISKMVEDFVKTGDVSGVITEAVREGRDEALIEVFEALQQELPNPQALRRTFIEKGWMPNRPEPGR